MRVTSTSTYVSMREALGAGSERVAQLRDQMGTGRRINSAADDPVGSATALRYRSQESAETAWQRSADDAVTRLTVADTALQSSSSALRRARELVVLAGNGTLSAGARASVADEIGAVREELLDLANTRHGGHAVFGGFAGAAVEQVAGAWRYAGDDGKVQRQVGAGVVVDVNPDGRTTFGFDQPPGEDLFSVLERLAAAARSGDQGGLAVDGALLQRRADGVLSTLGSVGATTNRVETARLRSLAYADQVRAERSSVEDLDLAEAVLQLTQARNGYEAALGAVAKADLPSLASFLR